MMPRTLSAAVLAVIVLTASTVAAVPVPTADAVGAHYALYANDPASDAGHDDTPGANASDDRPAAANDSRDRSEGGHSDRASDRRGPPTDLPAAVPDFVIDVHEQVRLFVTDSITNLGAAISAFTPDEPADAAENGSKNPTQGNESDSTEQARDDQVGDEAHTDWSPSENDDPQAKNETDHARDHGANDRDEADHPGRANGSGQSATANDHANATGEADHGSDARAPAVAGSPPADLPDPVPDFVGEIHRTVAGFLDGGVETLGDVVPELTPDGSDT